MNFIPFLLKPQAYSHTVTQIELIETHISWILLTGVYAYKIKKPVNFGFLDYSTLEKRCFYCQEEIRLNRRFSPQLYLQVVPITQLADTIQIQGGGDIIDYAVQMQQFSPQSLLSERIAQGKVTYKMMDRFADVIADFHCHAEKVLSTTIYGSVETIHEWAMANFTHIRPLLNAQKFLYTLDFLEDWEQKTILNHRLFMQHRKQQGFIRECHGDLHLGNSVFIHDDITLFDGIEFNPALRWIDVMNDIAFLVMDLQHAHQMRLAQHFLRRYIHKTGDNQGIILLPYYTVYRALVRAKVALLRWQQHENPHDFKNAEQYLRLALANTRQLFTT
jgi:uncharacterized protein